MNTRSRQGILGTSTTRDGSTEWLNRFGFLFMFADREIFIQSHDLVVGVSAGCTSKAFSETRVSPSSALTRNGTATDLIAHCGCRQAAEQ